MQKYDALVIGAGPAGLFASCNIKNMKVALIEKNETVGRKLSITGGGQCNISHKDDVNEMLKHYGSKSRFLKPALYNFSYDDLIKYMADNGLKLKIQSDGKVFPHTGKAQDVVSLLLNKCIANGVSIKTEEKVIKISRFDNEFNVQTDKNIYLSTYLILATGGKSYPNTGSTGDGYIFAQKMGHTIVKPVLALTPLIIKNFEMSSLAGLSFDVPFAHYRNGRKLKNYSGELLITHKGFSGPAILNMSGSVEKGDVIKINFAKCSREEFEHNLMNKVNKYGRQKLKTVLKEDFPKRFVEFVLNSLDISEINYSELKRDDRKKIIDIFTEFEATVDSKADFNIAMVTRGGIDTAEINSKTMESKIVPNLYFAGEIIDVDGETGGYNIQAALSEGYTAAQDINNKNCNNLS